MKKTTRYLVALCISAIIAALVLQAYWIVNYYRVIRSTFEKEVNMAMEDAVKKEFNDRCDTIERHIFMTLMDTTEFTLTNQYDLKRKTTLLKITDRHNTKDQSYLHTDSIGLQKAEDNFGYRTKMARFLAQEIRISELEGHFVFYHTQKLGDYVEVQTKEYDFDTARLRPILKRLLAERGISVSFLFLLRTNDSTYNKSHFDPALLANYPVITKAFVTFKKSEKDHYVRAMFNNPFSYIIARMGSLFAGSVVLILGIAFCLFYLLRSLYREKRLSAIKNDFISNITHEFKTPIATVSAAIEALTSFDVLDDHDKVKKYLNHSKNELNRLSGLVDKILNISLYENQQFDLKVEQLNVNQIINALLSEAVLASQRPIEHTYLNNSGTTTIYADKLYFQHTIINVVDNAIKYSVSNPKILVECAIHENYLVIMVEDNGTGISPVHLPFVFEKFYRVPTKDHHIKGHGLGLSYVKSIIEKHQGWCKIESEIGKGCKLYLAWPI